MKDYRFEVRGHSTKEIIVEAESEDEARLKLTRGQTVNEKELSFEELDRELTGTMEFSQ